MAALAISGGSLVACQLQPAFQAKEAPSLFTPKTQPSTYGVLTAKITGKHSGVAVIKLDSFRLNVSFDFEAHPDSYGVPGSEFTAVEITQLTVNEKLLMLMVSHITISPNLKTSETSMAF